MLPQKPRHQKIYVTCLVEHQGRVLLLRGSQYRDEASSEHIGYFGLPRFTLRFGVNPATLITKELEEQFGQAVEDVVIADVIERITNQHTQVVNLLYRVAVNEPAKSLPGRYQYVNKDELEQYVLPEELERLIRWL